MNGRRSSQSLCGTRVRLRRYGRSTRITYLLAAPPHDIRAKPGNYYSSCKIRPSSYFVISRLSESSAILRMKLSVRRRAVRRELGAGASEGGPRRSSSEFKIRIRALTHVKREQTRNWRGITGIYALEVHKPSPAPLRRECNPSRALKIPAAGTCGAAMRFSCCNPVGSYTRHLN